MISSDYDFISSILIYPNLEKMLCIPKPDTAQLEDLHQHFYGKSASITPKCIFNYRYLYNIAQINRHYVKSNISYMLTPS